MESRSLRDPVLERWSMSPLPRISRCPRAMARSPS